MLVVCLDLEGVLVPEIWIGVAEAFGIESLRLTTRDIPDYDVLMQQRLRILAEQGLGLPEIQQVIGQMGPLPGAEAFLSQLRADFQVLILSDTFYEFAQPLMRQLGWPTLFCHHLEVDAQQRLTGYRLRQNQQKQRAVAALQELNFQVVAAGDSYNDTGMLAQAQRGIFYCPPDSIAAQFPQFPVTHDYTALRAAIDQAQAELNP